MGNIVSFSHSSDYKLPVLVEHKHWHFLPLIPPFLLWTITKKQQEPKTQTGHHAPWETCEKICEKRRVRCFFSSISLSLSFWTPVMGFTLVWFQMIFIRYFLCQFLPSLKLHWNLFSDVFFDWGSNVLCGYMLHSNECTREKI